MHLQTRVFVIVQAGALELLVAEVKAQGLDQVQARAGIGAQADHIARVGRNFGLEQDDIEDGG